MDRERRHAEARVTNRKPRLMEVSELPAWLTKDPKELAKTILDQETLDLVGRGTRQRKEVDYSDSLTDKEWLRVREEGCQWSLRHAIGFLQAIEDGTLGSTEQEKKRRRKRRGAQADMDDDDEDEEIGAQDDGDSKQDDADADGSSSKTGRRAGKRKLRDTGKSSANEPLPAKLSKQLSKLLEFVIKYRDK